MTVPEFLENTVNEHITSHNLDVSCHLEGQDLMLTHILSLETQKVTLPCRMGAILDQAQAMDKTHQNHTKAPVYIGPFVLEIEERQIRHAKTQEIIQLTETECSLLAQLENAGAAGMQREDLLSNVWGYRNDTETHTLDTHIYRLRQKLEADPDQPQILVTIPGGYKIAG